MSLPRTPSLAFLAHAVRTERPAAPVYVVAGRFNLVAIMREAVTLARQVHARHGFSWARRMAIGLRTAWGRAKQERADQARTALVQNRPAAQTETPRSRIAPSLDRVRVFARGSRINRHGW